VGESAARAIVSAREEGGVFASAWDFAERIESSCVNKRVLEALVKCGAFDSTGARARACSIHSTRSSPGGRSARPIA